MVEIRAILRKIFEHIYSSDADPVKYVFRGESANFGQISSHLYRNYRHNLTGNNPASYTFEEIERRIISNARRFFPANTSDARVLERLHREGGKTSLIDFTRNLFVALYFAAMDRFDQDGRVICIRQSDIIPLDAEAPTQRAFTDRLLLINGAPGEDGTPALHTAYLRAPKGYIGPEENGVYAELIPKNAKKPVIAFLDRVCDLNEGTVYGDLRSFIDNKITLRAASQVAPQPQNQPQNQAQSGAASAPEAAARGRGKTAQLSSQASSQASPQSSSHASQGQAEVRHSAAASAAAADKASSTAAIPPRQIAPVFLDEEFMPALNDYKTYKQIIQTLFKEKKFSQVVIVANRLFQHGLQRGNDHFTDIFILKIRSLNELQQYETAERELTDVLSSSDFFEGRTLITFYIMRAEIKEKQRRFDAALEDYDRASGLSRNLSLEKLGRAVTLNIFLSKARIRNKQGKYKIALSELYTARSICSELEHSNQPSNAKTEEGFIEYFMGKIWFEYARIFLAQEDHAKVIENCKAALEYLSQIRSGPFFASAKSLISVIERLNEISTMTLQASKAP